MSVGVVPALPVATAVGGRGARKIPTAPTGLTATPSGTDVGLAWTDNADNETGFRVFRSTVQGFTPGPGTEIDQVGADVESYTDTGLTADTYYYRVWATNADGDSGSVEEASATVTESPPSAPTDPTIEIV